MKTIAELREVIGVDKYNDLIDTREFDVMEEIADVIENKKDYTFKFELSTGKFNPNKIEHISDEMFEFTPGHYDMVTEMEVSIDVPKSCVQGNIITDRIYEITEYQNMMDEIQLSNELYDHLIKKAGEMA